MSRQDNYTAYMIHCEEYQNLKVHYIRALRMLASNSRAGIPHSWLAYALQQTENLRTRMLDRYKEARKYAKLLRS